MKKRICLWGFSGAAFGIAPQAQRRACDPSELFPVKDEGRSQFDEVESLSTPACQHLFERDRQGGALTRRQRHCRVGCEGGEAAQEGRHSAVTSRPRSTIGVLAMHAASRRSYATARLTK